MNERPTGETLPDLRQDNAGLKSFPELVLNELGGDIVNSITLHELLNVESSNWNEPVAVLRSVAHRLHLNPLFRADHMQQQR